MAIPAKNVLGNPNVTEGNFQIAIEQLRESVIGSGKAYDSANTYSQYDTCVYNGVVYYSKINSNTGNTPTIGANWGLVSELIKLIASPTTNSLAKIQADGTIKNSGVIEYDNGNVGVNGSVVAGDPIYSSMNAFVGAILNNNNTTPSLDIRRWNGTGANHGVVKIAGNASGDMLFFTDTKTTNTEATTERMRMNSLGSLLIGTPTTNGLDKLQIEGAFSSKAPKAFVTVDLNTLKYRTETCTVMDSSANLPIAEAGFLEIFMFDIHSYWVMQRFTAIGHPNAKNQGRTYVRNWMNNSTWSAWVEK